MGRTSLQESLVFCSILRLVQSGTTPACSLDSCPEVQCLLVNDSRTPPKCIERLAPMSDVCKSATTSTMQCGRGELVDLLVPGVDNSQCNCCPFYDSPFAPQGQGHGGKGAWNCEPRLFFCGDAHGEFNASSPCGYGMEVNGSCYCCDTFELDTRSGKCVKPRCSDGFPGFPLSFHTERCAKGFLNESSACECCPGYEHGSDGRCVVVPVNGSSDTVVVLTTSESRGESFNSHHTSCYLQSRGKMTNVSGGSNCISPSDSYAIACSDSYSDPSLFNMSFDRSAAQYCADTSSLPVGGKCEGQPENLSPNAACRDGNFDIYSFCKGAGVCSKNHSIKCSIDNDDCWLNSPSAGWCVGTGVCEGFPCPVDCPAACALASDHLKGALVTGVIPVRHENAGKPVAGTSVMCTNGYDFKYIGCVCQKAKFANADEETDITIIL